MCCSFARYCLLCLHTFVNGACGLRLVCRLHLEGKQPGSSPASCLDSFMKHLHCTLHICLMWSHLTKSTKQMAPLIYNPCQVNGGAGQEPLPVSQDQPSRAGSGTMAETVQRLGQQISLSEQVLCLFFVFCINPLFYHFYYLWYILPWDAPVYSHHQRKPIFVKPSKTGSLIQ